MDASIAAVVVTYNRIEELKKNVAALLNQTIVPDRIFIIDNCSTDGTSEYFTNQYDRVEVVRLSSNTGGSGGFYAGTKIAYERGFDYIILMDDDGRPGDSETIAELMSVALRSTQSKIMLNPLVCADQDTLSFNLNKVRNVDAIISKANDKIYMDHINPFNGTLLNRALIQEIGYPNQSFFIKGDETDYSNRAKKAGAFIATVVSSHYYHPSITHDTVKVMRLFNVINDLEVPWKEYYRIRNYTYMYGMKILYMLSQRTVKSIFIHDVNWKNRIGMMVHGFYDGIHKKMGKNVEPGQVKYNKKINYSGVSGEIHMKE